VIRKLHCELKFMVVHHANHHRPRQLKNLSLVLNLREQSLK